MSDGDERALRLIGAADVLLDESRRLLEMQLPPAVPNSAAFRRGLMFGAAAAALLEDAKLEASVGGDG